MPVSYCWIDLETDKRVNLDEIDNRIAAALGETPSDKYRTHADPISNAGIAILMREGGSIVTEEAFNKFREKNANIFEDMEEEYIEVLRDFLYRKYKFEAWR